MRLNSSEVVGEEPLLQKIPPMEVLQMGTQPLPQEDFSDLQQPIGSTHPGQQKE